MIFKMLAAVYHTPPVRTNNFWAILFFLVQKALFFMDGAGKNFAKNTRFSWSETPEITKETVKTTQRIPEGRSGNQKRSKGLSLLRNFSIPQKRL